VTTDARAIITAGALAHEFDQSFAAPVRAPLAEMDDWLALRAGGDPHALRLAELAGLCADRPIVPLPARPPELLGIAGIRNALVPVFDLAVLLGYPAAPAPRWLVLVRGPQRVALAFETFEGHVRLPRDRVTSDAGSSVRRHLRGALHADAVRPIIDVASLLEAIARRARPEPAPGET
jgi:chemotaxis signal transduction protein